MNSTRTGETGWIKGQDRQRAAGVAVPANQPEPKAVNGFLNSMRDRDVGGMMDALRNAPLTVNKPVFTTNGNAVNRQEATVKSGDTEISLRFYNGWEPTAQTPPDRPISIKIEAVVYKNGNAQAIRTLSEKKTKSLKNAAKNYNSMLEEWKRLTKQKDIRF